MIHQIMPSDSSWESNEIEKLKVISNLSFTKNVVNTFRKEIIEQLKYDSNPKVVLDVASPRIENGESCIVVAEDHGIEKNDIAFDALQMRAVEGLAGQRVSNGESGIAVALAHGIDLHDEAFQELQMRAVEGVAGERVSNGEPFILVSNEHRIKGDRAYKELKLAIIAECVNTNLTKFFIWTPFESSRTHYSNGHS